MKINKLMYSVLAGAMLASCSEDLIGPDNGNGVNGIEAKGYIGVTVGMPSTPATRGDNDIFDDGDESEYAVKSVGLIFFKSAAGSDGSDPEFFKAYSVLNEGWSPVIDDPNQITQNRVVTFPVDFAQIEDDLWALAVINYNGLMTIPNDKESYSLQVEGNDFTGKFSDFMKLVSESDLYSSSNGFFMTNAPFSSVAGTLPSATSPAEPAFQVLAKVDKSRIFENEQSAKQQPAASIFVERAVAKVEVHGDGLDVKDGAITFPEGGDFKVTNVEWVLDNLEPTSYIVRNLDANADNTTSPYWALYNTTVPTPTAFYRFLGNAPFGQNLWPNTPDSEAHYRTYFCVDPSGDGIASGNLNVLEDPTYVSAYASASKYTPLYCHENTFSVANMDYRNTTRAVIKVTFGDGKTNVYTVGSDNKTVYNFSTAANLLAWEIFNDNLLVKTWKEYFDAKDVAYNTTATINDLKFSESAGTAENDWIKLTLKADATTGRLTITQLVLKNGEKTNSETVATYNVDDAVDGVATEGAKLIAKVNKNLDVKYFAGGVAYYAVRIKHFGDELTPWSTTRNSALTTQEAYGSDEGKGAITNTEVQNYLGRYGVVRNNWYVVELGQILQMGEPVQGDLPLDGTPDDRVLKEESISCRINILSWAKRNQVDNL